MKGKLNYLIAFVLIIFSSYAGAEIYKNVDAAGRVTYDNKPHDGSIKLNTDPLTSSSNNKIKKIQLTAISDADYVRLQNAKLANALRFERDFNGSPFSALAKFDSVRRSPTYLIPGHFATFKTEKVKITCQIQTRKNIEFVEKLNRGDRVRIDASFSATNLTDDTGFLFQTCKLSTPK